jgi:hypothetical protein
MDEQGTRDALLELVESDRAAQVLRFEAQSRERVRALLVAARHAARERVRAALVPERRRLREQGLALDARLATQRRLAGQRRLRERLDEAWRRLPESLASRWADTVARARWTAQALAAAAGSLGRGPARVNHAPGWPAPERDAFARALEARGLGPVTFEEDAGAHAGLAVRAGGNLVDATAAGLVADRAAIDARLADALGLGEAGP